MTMGVYIRNMAMPNNCMECMKSDLRSTIKCTEWKYLSAGLFESMRVNTCPLIEIKTPHGRLIDADKLFRDIEWDDIENAPTVIEAEDE